MMFEAEFARAERTAKVLHWGARTCAAVMLLGFLFATLYWPGPVAAPRPFTDIQIHLDLAEYFSDLGVKTMLVDDRAILGTSFGRIRMVLNVLAVLVFLIGLGSLLRLQTRWLIGCVVAWTALTMLSNSIVSQGAYRIADPKEFAVKLLPAIGVGSTQSIQYRALNRVPTALGNYYANLDDEAHKRALRAARIRGEFNSAISNLTPSQVAAMQYTAAQIFYMEENVARTTSHLNQIARADFRPTTDSDTRIRHMQEWVAAHGGVLAPAAYQPVTGLPLPLLRIIANTLYTTGLTCLFLGLAAAILARRLRRRLARMRKMQDLLVNTPSPTRMTSAVTSGTFGKRGSGMSQILETKYSG